MNATSPTKITSDQLRNTARFGTPMRSETIVAVSDQQDALLDAMAEFVGAYKDHPERLGAGSKAAAHFKNARDLLRAHGRPA